MADSDQDHQSVQDSLKQVVALLRKHQLVQSLVERQEMPRHELVESLVEKQNVTELRIKLDQMHPADVAYVLEALPLAERLAVWDLVKAHSASWTLFQVYVGLLVPIFPVGEISVAFPGGGGTGVLKLMPVLHGPYPAAFHV